MHTLTPYVNQSIDAAIMLRILEAGRKIPTAKAQAYLDEYQVFLDYAIRNYKPTERIENDLRFMRSLITARENWSAYCCDDCTHWVEAFRDKEVTQ